MPEPIVPHLFRTEYRKIVAVLCKRFGFAQIEVAEDIAGDTFLTATYSWGLNGVPDHPTAWLYQVAKNKARNHLQRQALFDQKIAPEVQMRWQDVGVEEVDLSNQSIADSQLQMMFAVCHPVIPVEAQVGLSLRILCGFGIDEIATAFLTNKATINKRLFRAREKLRDAGIRIELPSPAELEARLSAVLTTIYLLFNEGYYSASQDHALRKELCFEAMRLCTMLVENETTDRPEVNALLALMCFHASRFDARTDDAGELILYEEQDADRWNSGLIAKGGYFLQRAAGGTALSRYHLEAAIAYWHTQKADTPQKWEHILELYDHLLEVAYSPVAALNRAYALARVKGREAGIVATETLQLDGQLFYHVLLGELYTDLDGRKARLHYETALEIATTVAGQEAIRRKLDRLIM